MQFGSWPMSLNTSRLAMRLASSAARCARSSVRVLRLSDDAWTRGFPGTGQPLDLLQFGLDLRVHCGLLDDFLAHLRGRVGALEFGQFGVQVPQLGRGPLPGAGVEHRQPGLRVGDDLARGGDGVVAGGHDLFVVGDGPLDARHREGEVLSPGEGVFLPVGNRPLHRVERAGGVFPAEVARDLPVGLPLAEQGERLGVLVHLGEGAPAATPVACHQVTPVSAIIRSALAWARATVASRSSASFPVAAMTAICHWAALTAWRAPRMALSRAALVAVTHAPMAGKCRFSSRPAAAYRPIASYFTPRICAACWQVRRAGPVLARLTAVKEVLLLFQPSARDISR